MNKLKSAIKKLVFRYITPPVVYSPIANNSNSQTGEDRIVAYLFSSMKIDHISYLDIGAGDPVCSNNTYFFYTNNGKGILVEPDSNVNDRTKAVRPDDLIINAAISDDTNEEADFFIFNDPSLNTLSEQEAKLRTNSGVYQLLEKKRIKLITIENIIKDYLNGQIPDLISLDVEGMDYKVLNSFNFENYPVPVWIVETCTYSENHVKPKVTSIIDLMLSKGYFVYADTYINTIFVNRFWFENYRAG